MIATTRNELQPTALPALAERANAAHKACETVANEAVQHAIDSGNALIEAKALCKHGTWQPWLADNFDGSMRTGQIYMQLAREAPKLEAKAQRVALLTLRDTIAAVASNAKTIAAKPVGEQEAVIGTWEEQGCKNAKQAAAEVERGRSETARIKTHRRGPDVDEIMQRAVEIRDAYLVGDEYKRLLHVADDLSNKLAEARKAYDDLSNKLAEARKAYKKLLAKETKARANVDKDALHTVCMKQLLAEGFRDRLLTAGFNVDV